jgi:uncharacterized membrane protein YraQ (UPF0718 family)
MLSGCDCDCGYWSGCWDWNGMVWIFYFGVGVIVVIGVVAGDTIKRIIPTGTIIALIKSGLSRLRLTRAGYLLCKSSEVTLELEG